ncbi:MFS transporter [Filifactor alocis]|uniref:MFS transporter n=1 Tax=Filifactor alocis TaxID=143361 RepID=UPI0028D2D5EE|nr:MFS transporter [Filifactor alocis]
MIRTKLLSNKDGIITWCAIVIVIMVMFIQRQYIAVMSDFLIAKYQINISKATRLVNATLYGYAVMQIPMGMLLDYFGVRRVLIISWLVVCISTLVMTVTSCYGIALSMRFFIGVGMASSITSIMKVQTIWFDEYYFSHLSAGMALISNVGNLVATVPLSYLISKIGGQNTMWVISFITMVSVLLLFSFVKDKKEEIPEEINIKTSLSEVLCNRKSWSPIIIMFTFISTSTSLFGFWGIRFFSETYRLSVVDASKYMAFLSLGFMLGAPLVSIMDKIFDRNNKLNLNIFSGIYLLMWIYIMLNRGKPPLYIMPLLFVMMGMVLMFHLLPFAVIKNVNKVKNAGIATATVNSMEFFGSSILNFLIGLIVLRGVSVKNAMTVYLISALVCFISTFFINENFDNSADSVMKVDIFES